MCNGQTVWPTNMILFLFMPDNNDKPSSPALSPKPDPHTTNPQGSGEPSPLPRFAVYGREMRKEYGFSPFPAVHTCFFVIFGYNNLDIIGYYDLIVSLPGPSKVRLQEKPILTDKDRRHESAEQIQEKTAFPTLGIHCCPSRSLWFCSYGRLLYPGPFCTLWFCF